MLDKVPANVAEVIHADATHAFLQSMHVVYPIAALVIAVAIGVTLKWLPARAPVVAGGRRRRACRAAVGLEDALPDVPDDLVEPTGRSSPAPSWTRPTHRRRRRGPLAPGRVDAISVT